MITTVLYIIGVVFIILAAASFLGLFSIGVGAGGLLIVGVIAVVVAYLLSNRRAGI